MSNVPGKDIEVVEALASATVYHLQTDLAESRPLHAVGFCVRLCEELNLVTPVSPIARYSQGLEIQFRAHTHARSVGLEAQ